MSKTLLEKLWEEHTLHTFADGSNLLYIDRHLLHEVSSPQAFKGLIERSYPVFNPALNFAVTDHIVETHLQAPYSPQAQALIEALRTNAKKNNIQHFDLGNPARGIVHVIAPELGLALPGMSIVCGDSHACTLGALGCLAWGIGTSEVEHVLATQTIRQQRPRSLNLVLQGDVKPFVTAKDVALSILRKIGVKGGQGFAVEYSGDYVRHLPMESRFTLCNLTVETGAKIALIAPDDITFTYLKNRCYVPSGKNFQAAVAYWKKFHSPENAIFNKSIRLDVSEMDTTVTWGITPEQSITFHEPIPQPQGENAKNMQNALEYMGLEPGQFLQDIKIDYIFIGSCTNSRLSDLKLAAYTIAGKKVAPGVKAIVVPGSQQVKAQAEAEGLDKIFLAAGFEWRESGCSLCVALNSDCIPSGKRCLSTSNRNFEGRQGPGSRTHLASPLVAATSAITGFITPPLYSTG